MSSKISGLLRSRCFMRSFMAVMMICVLSSAPCFELFSAAPAERQINQWIDCGTSRDALYFGGSRHWGGPCIFHGTWRHTRYSELLVERCPREDLRTRSSRWVKRLSMAGSCAALCSKLGRWDPAVSFCTRAFSVLIAAAASAVVAQQQQRQQRNHKHRKRKKKGGGEWLLKGTGKKKRLISSTYEFFVVERRPG